MVYTPFHNSYFINHNSGKTLGFTLMETLLVFGLMGSIAIAGIVAYGQVKQREEIAATVQQITQLITSARSKSVAGLDDTSWRIDVSSNLIQLKNASGQIFQQYSIPSKYSLTSPVSELTFNRANGRVEACEAGCIFTLTQVGGTLTHQFGVLFSGTVEY